MLRVLTLAVAVLAAACGGSGGPASSPPAASATGSISAPTRCEIDVDGSNCTIEIGWSSRGATDPSLTLDGVEIASNGAGSMPVRLTHGVSTLVFADGGATLATESLRTRCVGEADWDGTACRQVVDKVVEFAPTPFVHDGEPVSLEVVLYRPREPGPYPTVVFHHGSTGMGDDPALFGQTFMSGTVARHFTRRGWLVAFPQRRGRGRSGGRYDEGFTPDRARYSCDPATALAGADRALEDLDALRAWFEAHPDVDIDRVVGAGFSRGGVLALLHGARNPGHYQGVVNFVGGWMSDRCPGIERINPVLFERAGAYAGDSLWIYGENDLVYRVAHSRANHAAFVAAGGRGTFRTYVRAPGLNGHFVMNDPESWAADLDAFLDALP